MTFWLDEGVENVWLNDQITRIFKSWNPEKFYNANEDGTVVILDKIVELVEKLNLDLSEIHLVHTGINSFDGNRRELAFDVGGMSDADIKWVVAHEIGHLVDWQEGRLRWVKGAIEFENERITFEELQMEYMSVMMATNENRDFLFRRYHRMVHEHSANSFALIHAGAIPESEDFIHAYETVR